ncbi:alanine acetyltransferase, partial [Stenotrophomonas sp.]|uniref:alanine acetyltransferase n=1 Tax=Stenotrophomonas sp. TaxID=69392 RepID=UPI0028AF1400
APPAAAAPGIDAGPVAVEPAPPHVLPAQPAAAAAPREMASKPPPAPSTAPAPVFAASTTAGVRRSGGLRMLRASGCNPNDPQTRALMDSWPLAELRANPAAKRALWPQLRALRRKSRQ